MSAAAGARRLHVVHLTNAWAARSGGVRTTLVALGVGYAARGHRLTVVVPGARTQVTTHPWGTLVQLPGPRVPGTGGYRALVDARAVRHTLDTLAPDRLEVSDRFTLRHVGSWARGTGTPLLGIAHERVDGLLQTVGHLPGSVARSLADRHNATTAAAFDRIVATTAHAAAEFDRIGVPTVRIPLGVDLATFRPVRDEGLDEEPGEGPGVGRSVGPSAGPSGEPATGVRTGPARLVLCSRLSPEKRPDVAVDAVRALLRQGVGVRLTVLGDGPERAALVRRSQDLPVEWRGFVADRREVARTLAAADAVLAPAPAETFGLAALEALACGTPVVAASSSAVPELLVAGTGRATACAAEPLAAATAGVLAMPRAAARRACRARAEDFGWDRTVEGFLAAHAAGSAEDVALVRG